MYQGLNHNKLHGSIQNEYSFLYDEGYGVCCDSLILFVRLRRIQRTIRLGLTCLAGKQACVEAVYCSRCKQKRRDNNKQYNKEVQEAFGTERAKALFQASKK